MGNPALRKVVGLKFNGTTLTVEDLVTRLKLSGELGTLLRATCRELAIMEAARADGVKPTAAELKKAQGDLFREMGVASEKEAAAVLKEVGLTLAELNAYADTDATVEKFKKKIVKDRAAAFFKEHWEVYETVEFTEIAVASLPLAREILAQLEEKEATFEQLAQEHSIAKESKANRGYAGTQTRADLPAEVRKPIFDAKPGTIVGPLKVDKNYYLVRVERTKKAKLDDVTKEAIETRLFDEWIEAQVARSAIDMVILRE